MDDDNKDYSKGIITERQTGREGGGNERQDR